MVANTGNVGIGTTTPGQKLTVNGTIESTSGGVKFPNGTTQVSATPTVNVYTSGSGTYTTPAGAATLRIAGAQGGSSISVYDPANGCTWGAGGIGAAGSFGGAGAGGPYGGGAGGSGVIKVIAH